MGLHIIGEIVVFFVPGVFQAILQALVVTVMFI